MANSEDLVGQVIGHIHKHRCYTHPIFVHWAVVDPTPEVIGALFHQIRCFCRATRPGGNFPAALRRLGLEKAATLLQAIVDSEEGHGAQLAAMAGFIVNRANRAGKSMIFPNLYDQEAVEGQLKAYSDQLLSCMPGYDPDSGLLIEARKAMAVFRRRKRTDPATTFSNLGVALALEIISNAHIIPGEKHCLVDSGLYGACMTDPEMRYLDVHFGEIGAEQHHQECAIEAVSAMLTDETEPLVLAGANDFLHSTANLWDVLDEVLLQSGYRGAPRAPVITM
jgi:hypothetical protein